MSHIGSAVVVGVLVGVEVGVVISLHMENPLGQASSSPDALLSASAQTPDC